MRSKGTASLVPQGDEERVAYISEALLNERTTEADFQWIYDVDGNGTRLRRA